MFWGKLSLADRFAVFWRARSPAAMDTPLDAISESAGRSIHYSQEVIAGLRDRDRSGASHVGGDLASFVDAAARPVQVREVNRDPIHLALVAVNSEPDGSLNLFLKILVPYDVACSNSDFHI
jgi:hypothetical protein